MSESIEKQREWFEVETYQELLEALTKMPAYLMDERIRMQFDGDEKDANFSLSFTAKTEEDIPMIFVTSPLIGIESI